MQFGPFAHACAPDCRRSFPRIPNHLRLESLRYEAFLQARLDCDGTNARVRISRRARAVKPQAHRLARGRCNGPLTITRRFSDLALEAGHSLRPGVVVHKCRVPVAARTSRQAAGAHTSQGAAAGSSTDGAREPM